MLIINLNENRNRNIKTSRGWEKKGGRGRSRRKSKKETKEIKGRSHSVLEGERVDVGCCASTLLSSLRSILTSVLFPLFLSPSAPPSGRKRQNSFAQKQPPLRQSIPRGIRFAPCTPALPNARANFIELVCKHRKHRRNCKWWVRRADIINVAIQICR